MTDVNESAKPEAEKGKKTQGIDLSRGGRTTKIHAITHRSCRPIRFTLTSGHVPDYVAAEPRFRSLSERVNVVQGDKGYDSNKVRAQIEAADAAPNIPPKSNRRYKPGFSAVCLTAMVSYWL